MHTNLKIAPDFRVGIVISTMNRADFIIRQLDYYAAVDCPHTIYIGDSSSPEEAKKITDTISRLKSKLCIEYQNHTNLNMGRSAYKLYKSVKEPYVCLIGDDDYQIPDSLTKCAKFLHDNPEYATAGGHAVSIRIKDHGVYGNIMQISDYPALEETDDMGSKRLLNFFKNPYSPIFYVGRTNSIADHWSCSEFIKDKEISAEMTPSALYVISGKSKRLDILSFIRQIHNRHYQLFDRMDWIMGENWRESLIKSLDIIAGEISKKDNLSLEKSASVVKQAFWIYLQRGLQKEYPHVFTENNPKKESANSLRRIITKNLPWAKLIYRRFLLPLKRGYKQISFEVTRPDSYYYKDFSIIQDSVAGKFKI